ncbi:hypothetical protein ACFYTQ_28150 [Nocardia sp. NPDC004068]|uniref:hypothetical protein n=1 Tax=Nocardia sp. NPDC004068 TaxID=3364303 RepID=UPI0036939E2F
MPEKKTIVLRWTETIEHSAVVNVPADFEPGEADELSDTVAELAADTFYAVADRDGFWIEKVLPSFDPDAEDLPLGE